ncbi:uncharacterized protein DUF4221 [Roseivirga ehrenbergii]|uniref:DUF4221 domain-containing protein n=1 Tax=Roseivirga ehrenbergii (strain DSM 102268 / JCM 13514 / KCTC 12282 / NCIMB 14502 / KMM 6017) TaxID=279360 RepID=A0A150WYA7_ROSEK|nr:DUF4221 family protein [Roseivirga ehrenbergii]KYG71444.1 hypothetical protein MB14_11770 [Roseivirga ehrenbergii]TCK99504.1 uncharacterized protein DUF4221 [Roseivirga ehrenbergii]
MKNTFWPILATILFNVSCSKQAENIENKTTSLKYFGEVALNHGELLLSSYGFSNNIVGQDSLLIYDQGSKLLVLFDLQKKIPIHTIAVNLDGPDFFDPPFQDAEIRNDSLFLLSRNSFNIYNLDGKALMRFRTEDLQTHKISSFVFDFHLTDFQLLEENKVLFSKVPIDVIVTNFQSQEKPKLFFTLNLLTKEISEIPVFSPKESLIDDRTIGYYNDFSFHSMVINHDSIIYSFPFTSKTFIYDMGTKEQTEIEAPFKFAENLREPISAVDNKNTEKWVDYVYSGPKFSAIERDDETGFYVRVVMQNEKLSNGDKKDDRYLMLLNEKLEVIEEIKLKEMVFIEPAVSNGIIYLYLGNPSVEGAYSFVAYEIVK